MPPHFFKRSKRHVVMLWNYIKIAWRNLGRRKLFAAVNILGLTVGLTCVAFLYLCVQQMLSRDKFHDHLSRIFLVQTNDADQNVFPLLDAMLQDFHGQIVYPPLLRTAQSMTYPLKQLLYSHILKGK